MVFSSVTFVLVFLPCFFVGYMGILCAARYFGMWKLASNTFLLFGSLIFYAWGGPKYIIILLASLFINFYVALYICSERKNILSHKKRIWIFTLGIVSNLALLGYFKYVNFFMLSGGTTLFNIFLPASLAITNFQNIALPLGISFFTFQGISYLIDVYRGTAHSSCNIIYFGAYLTMFPQLVAGPIVRYKEIEKELYSRHITLQGIVSGAERFVIGLAKKLFIADTLGRVADAAFALPTNDLSLLAAWAGIICYTLQIYYDFSGYSDMAIGLGRMLGFTFPENFNYPYISQSIREFWHRWHMTLSGWFKDYLYIPLGGNRHGPLRTILNLLVVFALCGFWHGAAWGFLLWGLLHGFFCILERILERFFIVLPRIIKHFYVLAVVLSGWVIFRAHDLHHAKQYFKGLLGYWKTGIQTNRIWVELFAGDVYLALLFGVIFAVPVIPALRVWWEQHILVCHPFLVFVAESVRLCSILLLFVFCLMPLFGATYNTFIYFRF